MNVRTFRQSISKRAAQGAGPFRRVRYVRYVRCGSVRAAPRFLAVLFLAALFPLQACRVAAQDDFSKPGVTFQIAESLRKMRETVTSKRFFHKMSVGGEWIPSGGDGGLGLTRFNADVSIPVPGPQLRNWSRSFFLVTPKFGYTAVDWKHDTEFPNSLYDAGLGITWMQPVNERWSMMANAAPRWSSDGRESHQSVRCSAMFGLTWTPNPRWKVMFGVGYFDRDDEFNVIPFGGVVWTPNEDWRLELMAPQARIAKRVRKASPTAGGAGANHWLYAGAGFGGGTWAIRSVGDRADLAEYREFSFTLGYEAVRDKSYTCNLEIAYLCGRKMEFDRGTQPTFKPDDSVAVRLKFAY